MQTPEWEDNDSLEPVEQQPIAETASRSSARDKVRILELRRRLEERLDSKRIEMEYGSDYLDDESIQ
ncbi:MAG: hypothetical protein F4X09_06040 [Gammaproteobacteria bacterium]|nr:hypothetical protein [Gammaproteobacteria bacterium]MYC59741.1 hypothetical protein [Gammaproteobacteria bacterium]MYH86579.1 hypothetical protein [Gammaproteobacteria bacterium]MYK05168.1 hypothetical protein [Gammaproteobacteria bacterium]